MQHMFRFEMGITELTTLWNVTTDQNVYCVPFEFDALIELSGNIIRPLAATRYEIPHGMHLLPRQRKATYRDYILPCRNCGLISEGL